MTLRYSDAARNFMAALGSYKDAFHNGKIEIYTGGQPATANAAVTGTLLCTITNGSAARTAEVLSTGNVTLTGGGAGSVDTMTVNSIDILGGSVPFNTSLAQTAIDVAAKINAFRGTVRYTAIAVGAVINIYAMPGTGSSPNGFVVARTSTTITTSVANMAGGVTAVNGLLFGGITVTPGLVQKLSTQAWTGVNANSGTAGYYRLYGSVADAGALDAAATFIREDGAIATSAVELNMSSTALTAAATTTISTWDRTFPTL
jgi:hypothetical protein